MISGIVNTSFDNSNKEVVVENNIEQKISQTQEGGQVLGRYYRAPQIFIYGKDQQYVSGGLIPLASTDEPAIEIGGYDLSGSAEVSLYHADINSVLDYLVHDKDGKQLRKSPDVSNFQFVTTVNSEIDLAKGGGSSRISLPLEETGIWYVRVKIGQIEANAFILRSNIGVMAEQGADSLIFWGQNFKTKRSISEGNLKTLSLLDSINEIQSTSFNGDGIAQTGLDERVDIAFVTQNNDYAIVPINLRYLNYGYSYASFQPKGKIARHFVFTDRPIYKPGDTVLFKAVLREDDDVRYTIPQGLANVKIFDDNYSYGQDRQPVAENSFPISADGTINGQFKLLPNQRVGYYSLEVNIPGGVESGNYWNGQYSSSTVYFNVQYYQKPEFSLDVTTSGNEFIAGDKASFKIMGSYFSGQPLLKQKVKYTVRASDFFEYQYLTNLKNLTQDLGDDFRYGYWYGSNKVQEGTATLGANGEVEIDLNTSMTFNKGRSQVFSIEASIDDGSLVPSVARRNVLVYSGEYGIYRSNNNYGTKINTPLTLPLALVANRDGASLGGVNLTAKIVRKSWISFQEENKKYLSYREEKESLSDVSAKTDSSGKVTLSFTPTKTGSYNITVEGKDSRGNVIAKEFYSYVSADDQPYYSDSGDDELSIAADKQKYEPDDTAKLSIYSAIPDRDVMLFFERGRLNRYQLIRMTGKNATVSVPLESTDVPNIFARVASFSNFTLNSSSINLPVSSDGKKLLINVNPGSKTYGPGETASVDIVTTDVNGSPVSADVALWAVDKAIFELTDTNLGDIFEKYWSERSNSTQTAHSLEGIVVLSSEGGGGCFAEGTKVLMANGKYKDIEKIKPGEFVYTRAENDDSLIKAKVTGTHNAKADGYLIINSNLRVTPNHILWVNGAWQEAGSIQVGDTLIESDGKYIKVNSIEWQQGKYTVFNLEVEKYHTYFADGVWVHNQKGDGGRDTFKDTAYWNPTIHTDSSGHAKVTFSLPDNLTTWVIAAVGSTTDTKVGQKTSEIVVTKDIIVRPILPNILRTTDNIVLSALVQNFTDKNHNFDINLKFDSGEVVGADQMYKDWEILANDWDRVAWDVKPNKANEKAKLTYEAKVKGDSKLSDVITKEIPVRDFGFQEKRGEAGENDKVFQVKLAFDSDKEKSSATLSLSPTILGTLPSAIKYLVGYPYGCVEQTTSRFAPTVIAKLNKNVLGTIEGVDLDGVIDKGVSRLIKLQSGDGGWAWWSSGRSSPYVTSYVVEYLLQARKTGAEIPEDTLRRAKEFLALDRYYDPTSQKQVDFTKEEWVAKNYGLTLLGVEKERMKKIDDFSNLTPDILSIAVMTNYLNGNKDAGSNGLNILSSMAVAEGDSVFWREGNKLNFGSKDASTALAIRAIVLADGDRDLAAKAARYLIRNKKYDYWSNTYATSQIVRALVDLSKTGDEQSPNYSYAVSLDGKQVAQGKITGSKQTIKDIEIPLSDVKSEGSEIKIVKSGDGQIYSTLVISEFHTDRSAPAVSNGLTVEREYVNEKGDQYTLGVGDTVLVKLTVGGLKSEENYVVIQDELPSGLVPVNETLKNEQYGNEHPYNNYYTSYDITDRETTENGMILTLYQMATGKRTYTYRARVVSEGRFNAPPAMASLMYAPEVYGRSTVQILDIESESRFIPSKGIIDFIKKYWPYILGGLVAMVGIGVSGYFIIRRIRNRPPQKPAGPAMDQQTPSAVTPPIQ